MTEQSHEFTPASEERVTKNRFMYLISMVGFHMDPDRMDEEVNLLECKQIPHMEIYKLPHPINTPEKVVQIIGETITRLNEDTPFLNIVNLVITGMFIMEAPGMYIEEDAPLIVPAVVAPTSAL